MFPGLPSKKKSQARQSAPVDGVDTKACKGSTRFSDGVAPFSASPYKQVGEASFSWMQMDMSLMPQEIADEIGDAFRYEEPAVTGNARELPKKLSPSRIRSEAESAEVAAVSKANLKIQKIRRSNGLPPNAQVPFLPFRFNTLVLPSMAKRRGVITGRGVKKTPRETRALVQRAPFLKPKFVPIKKNWIEMDWKILEEGVKEEVKEAFQLSENGSSSLNG